MRSLGPVLNRRVLVIDDNPAVHVDFTKILGAPPGADATLESAELALFGAVLPAQRRQHFTVDAVRRGELGLERVKAALAAGNPYALAFVDMRMPNGWDGLETIEHLWQADPHLQVVICSAHVDYDWTGLVVRLGQPDNLLVIKKPFEPVEILQCANALTRKWQNEWHTRRQLSSLEQEVTDSTAVIKLADVQLRHFNTHDSLTGLPNRAMLEELLAQALVKADADAKPLAVLFLNLDRFKLVNDSMGHRLGDEFLKEVAQRLKNIMRGDDTIARLGADEFVMMLGSVNGIDGAMSVAERALAALAPPLRIHDVILPCSASIGIALYPTDASTVADLFSRADTAMQSAKQLGGNRVASFDFRMNTTFHAKMKLELDLRGALADGELELFYQPKVDTQSGAVHSAEALIRWRHPKRGLVPPGDFIPLAEECGLIAEIGEWVVREACRQARAWQLEGLPQLRIAVNLSPTQFRHGNLLAIMRAALDDAGLDARYLEVELTENTVMSDAEGSVAILEKLSEMGVLVSVDDFGTGYSSMSYLRRFPVDKLKIDRAFISEIVSRPDDASIVRAIVSLAHSLRLKVVAEGVETREQLEFLKSLGCDQYQGYYFSPAVPAADFAKLLHRSMTTTTAAFMDEEAIRTHSKLAAYRR